MSKTRVIQSHRSPLPYSWLNRCLDSVRHWCELNQFDYQFLGDELFDGIAEDLLRKLESQKVIASDLARLHVLHDALNQGCETVIWLDADFLIFDPINFTLPNENYAVGREVWVQFNAQRKLKAYKKVHNAFLMFRQDNSFLPFYKETAERLLRYNQGGIPSQFVGPKLLTALHNVVQLPVMEVAGMLSPRVIKDVIQGGGGGLALFNEQSSDVIAGANLCISSCDSDEITSDEMEQLITILLQKKYCFSSNRIV